ncbi:hypothetical protein [Paracoccus sp. SSK6]|uniref:hypothetical protein n=1 Tax=Paracoccus sp. SSK6 TaxID=3143131 RepID=UPI003219F560
MAERDEVWHPGSFTKNFSWGGGAGLSELHSVIRAGFADTLEDVPRALFRERIATSGRPDYIPMNFFLFNRVVDGEDIIVIDELVFQALCWDHSLAFDRVALFAFLFSYVGRWKGSKDYQRRPAMWANAYVVNRIAKDLDWDVVKVTADDIERYVAADPRYKAETTRKLATNLNYLLHIGHVEDFSDRRVTRWWVDCLFLALDRLIEDAGLGGKKPSSSEYQSLLVNSDFFKLTGERTLEKDLALQKLVYLYFTLGGRSRFYDEVVRSRVQELVPEQVQIRLNDHRPRGAVHPTNPRILKSIPPCCSQLAYLAGFQVITPDELENFDALEFVKQRSNWALAAIEADGIEPTMSIEELLTMTRAK